MGNLRLGVHGVVVDDAKRVLLSLREDMNIWVLPGGRLDRGESLSAGAQREVYEETGIIAQMDQAIGLYYQAGWQRMNILFRGWVLGGELQAQTDETTENRFFQRDEFPAGLREIGRIRDAFAKQRPYPQIHAMSAAELRRSRWQLRWRWVRNLLNGRPEPRYPVFHIRATAVIWDAGFHRVLTMTGNRGRVLPRVPCDGSVSPWEALQIMLKYYCHITPKFQWVGVWQNPAKGAFDFVFAANMTETPLPPNYEWSTPRNTPLSNRDMDYINRVNPSYATDPVWMMLEEDLAGSDSVLLAE